MHKSMAQNPEYDKKKIYNVSQDKDEEHNPCDKLRKSGHHKQRRSDTLLPRAGLQKQNEDKRKGTNESTKEATFLDNSRSEL